MMLLSPMLLNLIYATAGSALSLIISWIAIAIFQKRMGFLLRDALADRNLAVGIVMMGVFIGNGVGMGIIIGMSLN